MMKIGACRSRPSPEGGQNPANSVLLVARGKGERFSPRQDTHQTHKEGMMYNLFSMIFLIVLAMMKTVFFVLLLVNGSPVMGVITLISVITAVCSAAMLYLGD